MTGRTWMLSGGSVLALLLASGCSDPLDDEPKGQTIPTHAELATTYAAGSGPGGTGSGGGSAMSSSANGAVGGAAGAAGAGSEAAPQQGGTSGGGLVSGAQGGGGAATSGSVPPAGLQSAPSGGAMGGQGGMSGQGGTSGAGAGTGGGSGGGWSANRTGGQNAMRRDAETNYLRLLHAGRLAMQEAGGTASIEAICATAGVTRATFYRHFPDRAKLHIAVLDLELEEMAKALAVPDIAPLAFLRMLTDMTTIYDRYLLAMPELPEYAEAESNGDKIIAVIAPSLERAQALGLIRQDVTGYDVMVACRMAGSDWRLDRQASQKDALEHRLSLILKGLAGT